MDVKQIITWWARLPSRIQKGLDWVSQPAASSACKAEPERFSRKEAQEAQRNIHSFLLCTLAARTTARLVHEYELAERRPVH